jgi:hypothetical protein
LLLLLLPLLLLLLRVSDTWLAAACVMLADRPVFALVILQ